MTDGLPIHDWRSYRDTHDKETARRLSKQAERLQIQIEAAEFKLKRLQDKARANTKKIDHRQGSEPKLNSGKVDWLELRKKTMREIAEHRAGHIVEDTSKKVVPFSGYVAHFKKGDKPFCNQNNVWNIELTSDKSQVTCKICNKLMSKIVLLS